MSLGHGALFSVGHGALYSLGHGALFSLGHVALLSLGHGSLFSLGHGVLLSLGCGLPSQKFVAQLVSTICQATLFTTAEPTFSVFQSLEFYKPACSIMEKIFSYQESFQTKLLIKNFD